MLVLRLEGSKDYDNVFVRIHVIYMHMHDVNLVDYHLICFHNVDIVIFMNILTLYSGFIV